MELTSFVIPAFDLAHRSDHVFVVAVDVHRASGNGRRMDHSHNTSALWSDCDSPVIGAL